MKLIVRNGLLLGLLATAACDVNKGRFNPDQDFNAGGADPYNFPLPYRGASSNSVLFSRQTAGSGTFTEIAAFAGNNAVGYFSFPFSPGQILTTSYSAPSGTAWPQGVIDPLRVDGPGANFRASANNPVPTPLVYSFDPPTDGPKTQVDAPTSQRCKKSAAPYNAFLDAYPQDQQWNIFTFLPDRFTSFPFGALATWSYRPVVAEVKVGTGDIDCQAIKSERRLLAASDDGKVQIQRGDLEADKLTRLGTPDGNYLAWALIDPGAAVVRVGETVTIFDDGHGVSGTSVQKYGWYAQFIVAYIDGGYIPVEDGPRIQGAPTKRMRTMRLYYPRSTVDLGDSGTPAPGRFGQGYDVVQGDRFADDPSAYSPVCELWTYDAGAGTATSALPTSEADILANFNTSLEPARTTQLTTAYTPSTAIVPRYVFCLQAAVRAPAPKTTAH